MALINVSIGKVGEILCEFQLYERVHFLDTILIIKLHFRRKEDHIQKKTSNSN